MLCESWTLELLWFWRNSLILKGCMLRTQTAAFPHLSCLLPRQIYILWEYEFLSGPDPEKCISTGLFVVMENCCSPWDPFCESLLITSGAGTVKAKLSQLQLHVGTCPWWPEQDYLQTPLQPSGASAAGPGLLKALSSLLFGPRGNSKNRINLTNEQSTFYLCQLIHLQWQQLPLLLLRKLSHTSEWSLCSEYSFFLFQKTVYVSFQTQSFGWVLSCMSLLSLLLVTWGITVIPRFC